MTMKKESAYEKMIKTLKNIKQDGYKVPGEFPKDFSQEFAERYIRNVNVAMSGELNVVPNAIMVLYFASLKDKGFLKNEAVKELDSLGKCYSSSVVDLLRTKELDSGRAHGVDYNTKCYYINNHGISGLRTWKNIHKKEWSSLEKLEFR